MKLLTIPALVVTVLTIAACTVSKKESRQTSSSQNAAATVAAPRIAPSVASADGVFSPGNAELSALQLRHKEVTMQALVEGYKLYTGICTQCHLPKSIYDRPPAAWPAILSSMAQEAKISDAQKDAIYKYVLAIKATQPQ